MLPQGRFAEKWILWHKFVVICTKIGGVAAPPPEVRIFSASFLAWSSTNTRRLRLPASIAHINPAAPAPMITTS